MACVLVCGVPRSGTSLIAATLAALGVSMGQQVRIADEWTKHGFHEDCEIAGLQLAMIHRPTYTLKPSRPELQGPHDTLIAERDKQNLWGLKTYSLILHAEHVGSLVKAPLLINTRRTLASSIASATARGLQQPEASCTHAAAALDGLVSRWTGPRLEITWKALTGDNAGTVKHIAEFIGQPVNDAAVALYDPAWDRFGGE